MTDSSAGRKAVKAKVLYRLPDGSTVLEIDDGTDDDVMWWVHPDGSKYEERIVGVRGLREAWEQSSAPPAVEAVVPLPGLPPEHAGRAPSSPASPSPRDPQYEPPREDRKRGPRVGFL